MYSPKTQQTASSSASTHFLGLDLAQDNLRAVLVDDQLDVVLVESVNFDQDIPDLQTRGGVLSTSHEVQVAPLELWLRALDLLFERLRSKTDLSRIQAIGGSAVHAPIWLASTGQGPFPPLDPSQALYQQIYDQLTLSYTPLPADFTSHAPAMALEAALGGPDKMAYRVGITAHSSLLAAQIMRLREHNEEAWRRTHKVGTSNTFLEGIFSGVWSFSMEDAWLSGMWNIGSAKTAGGSSVNGRSTPSTSTPGWDKNASDYVAGGPAEGQHLRDSMGEVNTDTKSRTHPISRYWVDRYGFDAETEVCPFIPPSIATYLSVAPGPLDGVLHFGHDDIFMAPTTLDSFRITRLCSLIPHPAAPRQSKKWIGLMPSNNADVPRGLVKDMYTKTWSAFDRLVAIVPPGGSIGLDNKLFAFWIMSSEGYPHTRNKGVHRFELGAKVHEFRDLRANPRCLIESQLLSFRVRFARLVALGLFAPPVEGPPQGPNAQRLTAELGLGFNPYENNHLPRRIICTGMIATCGSVVNCLTDVFNASVFVPHTTMEEAGGSINGPSGSGAGNRSPSVHSVHLTNIPSRPALGAAYLARWIRKGGEKDFESEVKDLLLETIKRRSPTGRGRSPRPGPGGMGNGSSAGIVGLGALGRPAVRSGLSAFMIHSDDEDDITPLPYESRLSNGRLDERDEDIVLLGGGERMMTASSSGGSLRNSYLSPNAPSTAVTSPEPSYFAARDQNQLTHFTPITALEDLDNEGGGYLSKVAEPDIDAFMQYAALVPEYCRLEGLVVRGAV